MTIKPENSTGAAVIVAAGRGERIGSDGKGPKQYRILGNLAILSHTILAFLRHEQIDRVQVVIHVDDAELYAQAIAPLEELPESRKLLPPVPGGKTRQESCAAGTFALAGYNPEHILIHDAARPFVSSDTITTVLSGIKTGECALPVHRIADTVKRLETDGLGERVVETVPRDDLALAQTPQGFLFAEILKAHEKARDAGHSAFTDDAAVAEWAGMTVRALEVSADNPKITTRHDLEVAKRRVTEESTPAMTHEDGYPYPDIRTGNGYDVHATIAGDHVWLAGLKIPHSKGLSGHSDADVALHALTDALLGTIGAGDIGSHFPPSDEKWKGAASDQFLQHALALIGEAGGKATHVDVTIICEVPKIGPHREAMRQSIANISGIDLERISVKATTNEKIGFIGRNEGIAAIATATVFFNPDNKGSKA